MLDRLLLAHHRLDDAATSRNVTIMETLRREFSFPADGVPDRTSSLQNAAIAIEVVFPALALLVLGLRTYIRTITRTFGWGEFFHLDCDVWPTDKN